VHKPHHPLLKTPSEGHGLKFSDQIKDDLDIKNINVKFSSFMRLGIRDANIKDGSLLHCIFEDVYARKGTFSEVNFTGSKFRDCNFEKGSFNSCIFDYCEFNNTQLPHREIIACLPTKPNIREELARNLKVNFIGLGQKEIADLFLDIEIKAQESRMVEIFKSRTNHYKENYDLLDRLENGGLFIWSWVKRFFSGNGYSIKWICISFLFIVLLLSSIIHLSKTPFSHALLEDGPLNAIDSFKVIFAEAIKYSHSGYSPTERIGKLSLFIMRFFGILYLGLITATIYRNIAR